MTSDPRPTASEPPSPPDPAPARDGVTPVVRISEPREMLAFLPYAIGFRPTESVVVASLRPPRGRIGLVARLDTADLAGPDGAAVAAALAGHLARDGAVRVFVAVYTPGDPWKARRPDGSVARALATLLAAPDLPPPDDPWVVGRHGYACWTCTDETCCPRAGRPLADLEGTQVAAHMVLAGERPADRRADLVPRTEPAGPRPRAAARAVRRLRGERDSLAPDDVGPWRLALLARVCALLEGGDAGAVAPRELGELAAALEDAVLRDVVIAWLVLGRPGEDVAELDVDAAFEEAFLVGGVRPRTERVRAAQRVLEAAAGLVPREARVHVLVTLAWTCWWSGDGARSLTLVRDVLRTHPWHRLAGLLETSLEGGLGPGWSRSA